MSEPFSTNELLMRSDRIAFGKIPPELPVPTETILFLPDATGTKMFLGFSTIVSTNTQAGTLERIYPQNVPFTFDIQQSSFGINNPFPQYTLDIQTNTGIRISGGTIVANASGIFSVPTAALFSTLPTSVFAPGTIPTSALASTGTVIQGISVPTSALFSTLPTSLYAPSSIPLVALQSSGMLIASSFMGDGYYLSNIPLANINADITGDFFKPNTIPLSSLASTGQIWIRNTTGSVIAPFISTSQFTASSITTGFLSSYELRTSTITTSVISASSFTSFVFNAANISAFQIRASSLTVAQRVTAGSFAGEGSNITSLNPAALYTTIPSDKFGFQTISFLALSPYGTFQVISGDIQFRKDTTTNIQGFLYVSSIYGDGSQLFNINAVSSLSIVSTVRGLGQIYVSTPSLFSTVAGLGTAQYISSAQLLSTTFGLERYISSFIDPSELASSLIPFISTAYFQTQLTSTVEGLGSADYVSTLSLRSTTRFFETAGFLSTPNLLSTVQGLGSSDYVSTLSLVSTVAGLAASGIIYRPDLASTVAGLGQNYVSTASLFSTVGGLGQTYVSTPSLVSTTVGLANALLDNLGSYGYVSSLSLVSTTVALQTAGFISSPNLLSTVEGLGQTYVSTPSLVSTVAGLAASGIVYRPDLASTVIGLGSSEYISSAQLLSTTFGLERYISSFIDPAELASSILPFISSTYFTTQLQSTVEGLGSANYISTASLTSTVQGLGSYGYFSSFLSTFSTLNASSIRVPYISSLELWVSSINGLPPGSGSLTSIPSSLSTFALFTSSISATTIQTQITSTLSLFVSSINGQTLVAPIQSSIIGLGTAGYISTASLRSTLISTTVSVGAFFSSLSTSYRNQFNTVVGTISALTVSSLTFGTGDGYLSMPDIRPTAMSTLVAQTSSLAAFNLQIGATSTVTAIQFFGLQGNFNNTVLAERSTGTGTQEFLVFKGSSTQDQIRFQTTGNFIIESGVSSRLWPNVVSNTTPSFLIDTNSNVGIQTASPGATFDVAGTSRALTLSTQQLRFSTIFGPFAQGNVFSSVQLTASSIFATLAGPTTTVLYEV